MSHRITGSGAAEDTNSRAAGSVNSAHRPVLEYALLHSLILMRLNVDAHCFIWKDVPHMELQEGAEFSIFGIPLRIVYRIHLCNCEKLLHKSGSAESHSRSEHRYYLTHMLSTMTSCIRLLRCYVVTAHERSRSVHASPPKDMPVHALDSRQR